MPWDTPEVIDIGKDFQNRTPKAQELIPKVNIK